MGGGKVKLHKLSKFINNKDKKNNNNNNNNNKDKKNWQKGIISDNFTVGSICIDNSTKSVTPYLSKARGF